QPTPTCAESQPCRDHEGSSPRRSDSPSGAATGGEPTAAARIRQEPFAVSWDQLARRDGHRTCRGHRRSDELREREPPSRLELESAPDESSPKVQVVQSHLPHLARLSPQTAVPESDHCC